MIGKLSTICAVLALLGSASIYSDQSPQITDEALRLATLRVLFPGMRISVDSSKKIDHSWPEKPKAGEIVFPDALAGETVYEVTGNPMNEVERAAAEDIVTQRISNVRQVKLTLLRWPRESNSGMIATLQYSFAGSAPPMSCPSIGVLAHIVRNSANWTVKEKYLLETVHHNSLQGIRLIDGRGKSADQLVVESDWGGGGTIGSTLYAFDLRQGRFDEVLETESRLQSVNGDRYTQMLDLGRTGESHSQLFCFVKTASEEEGKAFDPPHVTHPCYKRGEGVDANKASERNQMLEPSR